METRNDDLKTGHDQDTSRQKFFRPERSGLLFILLITLLAVGLHLGFHLLYAQRSPVPDGPGEVRNLTMVYQAGMELSEQSVSILDISSKYSLDVLVLVLVKTVFTKLDDYSGAIASLVLFTLLVAWSAFYITKKITGQGLIGGLFGMLAAAACLFNPGLFAQAHIFNGGLLTTALVAVSLALFFASKDLSRLWLAPVCGLVAGLAVLTSAHVWLFLIGPLSVSFLTFSTGDKKTPLGSYIIGLSLLISVAVAVWLLFPGSKSLSLPGAAIAFTEPDYYPLTVFKQFGALGGILGAIGIILALVHRAPARWHLLTAAGLPLVGLAIIPDKQVIYLLPSVFCLTVLAVAGFAAARGRLAVGLVLSFLFLLGCLNDSTTTINNQFNSFNTEGGRYTAIVDQLNKLAEQQAATNQKELVVFAEHRELMEYLYCLTGTCREVQPLKDEQSGCGPEKFCLLERSTPEDREGFAEFFRIELKEQTLFFYLTNVPDKDVGNP